MTEGKMDIVERLRRGEFRTDRNRQENLDAERLLAREAADEIARLRAYIRQTTSAFGASKHEILRLRAEIERLRNEKRQFLGIAIEMGDILAAAAKARGVNFPHLDEAMASLSRVALAEEQTP